MERNKWSVWNEILLIYFLYKHRCTICSEYVCVTPEYSPPVA